MQLIKLFGCPVAVIVMILSIATASLGDPTPADPGDLAKEPIVVYAARVGNLPMLRHLISTKANINAKDVEGKTALLQAAVSVHPDCVEALIKAGVDLSASGWTALDVAAYRGDIKSIRAALIAKEPVDATDAHGDTALMWAAREGGKDCVRALIKAGAHLNLKDHDGYTALMTARPDCVEPLVKAGANVDEKDPFGETCLMTAAERGDAALMLAADRDVTAVDYRDGEADKSPEEIRQEEKVQASCVQALILAGAKLNIESHDGKTALMYAVERGNTDCTQVLTKAGAKVAPRS